MTFGLTLESQLITCLVNESTSNTTKSNSRAYKMEANNKSLLHMMDSIKYNRQQTLETAAKLEITLL